MKNKQLKSESQKKAKEIAREIAMAFWSGGYNYRGSIACTMQDTETLDSMLKRYGLSD